MKKQWKRVGIDLRIEVLSRAEILNRISNRDFDLLLFGQNLGYNLDAFGYWHLSQAEAGLNLSNYQSLQASVLLEEIRRTHDEKLRQESLAKLQKIIAADVPAIFLFSPEYVLPIDSKIKNLNLQNLALFPDRFANIEKWYVREKRSLRSDVRWWHFFGWVAGRIF